MIYFDNAATTFIKPKTVSEEMLRCMREYGGNPGRSAHRPAMLAAEKIYGARELVSSLFGISKPQNVIFTQNCTHALNLAIFGCVRRNSHAICTNLDHNSVLRPLHALSLTSGVKYDVADALADDDTLLSEIESKIKSSTCAIVTCHVPNTVPRVLPVAKIGLLAKKHGIAYIVDGAQSAGIHRISVNEDNISVLCLPGHKGLYGPQGSGIAVFSDSFDFSSFAPFMYGGNGANSNEPYMGFTPPESYEAGTLAVPCIAGLSRGIEYISSVGTDNILRHETALASRLKHALSPIGAYTVYRPDLDGSTVLLNVAGTDATTLAGSLAHQGICVRSGLHCAPLAHKALNTGGDALRVSFSAFNTLREVDVFCERITAVTAK